MLSGNPSLRYMTWLLSGLALLFAVVWQAPGFYSVQGLASYLPVHMLAETFSIVVAMLVFGVAWNAYSNERPGNIVILACALLAVGLIDFAHTLSFKGMPEFITPSGPEKAINLWLSARLVAALALLAVALRSWQPLADPRSRYRLLAGSVAVALAVSWLGVAHPEIWPRTFIAGEGLTPFKIGAEYAIVAILLVPAVLFYRQARRPQTYDAASLFAATVITILSELSFTLYSDVADVFNLLGHIYKIVAYFFIYRAVFVASVREPFRRLDAEFAENRRIAKELRTVSLYTRSLIEASLDPLVTINAEGKITDVNHATEQATGRSRTELIGTDFSDYFTEPDKARAGYQQVFLKGSVTDYELALRHRDGQITDVLYNASLYCDEAGGVLGVFAAARDITKRKKAETELRELNNDFVTLLENTGDFIYFKDKDSRFRFCSQTLAGITGHRSWRDMVGKHDLEVFPEDTARIYYEEELPIFREGRPLLNKTDPYYDVQGRRRWVNTNKWPVFGEDGKTVVGIFGISRDITDLKEAEDKINELNRELEQRVALRTAQLEAANKELEAFSYSVSHDLRTPLRAIDGFSRILLEDYAEKLDDEGKRLLNVVRDNTGRMGQLIDDILQFSRTGRLELNPAEIDMEGLARTVLDELLATATGPAPQVEIGRIPPARCDRAMMRQVFANLLSNALKFSRGNPAPRVEVGGAIEGNEAVYFVKDNGVGFDMQYVDKLFGVFQRLHGVTEFEGTGIGLAIVKRVVTRHGGRVWAEGKVNEGATIYFALPI
jgi:PAS domain S-box-containing protein